MALETFCSTLGNAYLQRHMLAIETPTLEAAVRAGNEFLQIKPEKRGAPVRGVEDEDLVTQVASTPATPTSDGALTALMKAMEQLMSQVAKLEARQNRSDRKKGAEAEQKRTGCYGCGKLDHIRKDCPTNPWPAKSTPADSGNGAGPQQ